MRLAIPRSLPLPLFPLHFLSMTYELLYEHETPMYQRRLVLPPPSIFLDLPTIFPNLFFLCTDSHFYVDCVYTCARRLAHHRTSDRQSHFFLFFYTHVLADNSPKSSLLYTHSSTRLSHNCITPPIKITRLRSIRVLVKRSLCCRSRSHLKKIH